MTVWIYVDPLKLPCAQDPQAAQRSAVSRAGVGRIGALGSPVSAVERGADIGHSLREVC
jgi:hypothetical protein